MNGASTEVITVSLTTEVADMLHAFNVARNGSIHNSANEVIRKGILVQLNISPTAFYDSYQKALAEKARKPSPVSLTPTPQN